MNISFIMQALQGQVFDLSAKLQTLEDLKNRLLHEHDEVLTKLGSEHHETLRALHIAVDQVRVLADDLSLASDLTSSLISEKDNLMVRLEAVRGLFVLQ